MPRVSTKVADQTEGALPYEGGADIEVVDAYYVYDTHTKYHKPGAKTGTLAIIEMKEIGTEDVNPVFYSLGDAARLAPSEDGENPIEDGKDESGNPLRGPYVCAPEGSNATGVTKSCNMGQFFASLELSGDNTDYNAENSGGLAQMVGRKYHVERVAQVERKGFQVNLGPGKENFKPTIVLVTKVLDDKAPAKAAATKGKTAPAAGTTTAAKAPAAPTKGKGPDIPAMAQAVLAQILKENGETPKNKLSNLAFKIINADGAMKGHRPEILKQLVDDEFLASQEGVGFDGTSVVPLE